MGTNAIEFSSRFVVGGLMPQVVFSPVMAAMHVI
jgi:hypothetical protein